MFIMKQEADLRNNPPVIIQQPDIYPVKSEPEENYCLELVDLDEIPKECTLKISAVTELYDGDPLRLKEESNELLMEVEKPGKVVNSKNIVKSSSKQHEKVEKNSQKSEKFTKKSEKSSKKVAKLSKKPEKLAIKSEKPTKTPKTAIKEEPKNLKTLMKIKLSTSVKNKPKTSTKTEPPVEVTAKNSIYIKPEEIEQKLVQSELEFLSIPEHIASSVDKPAKKKRRTLNFICDHCGKIFLSKYSIVWHMKAHMLTMPFNCNVCGKGFSYERSFKQHELTHASKIKCEICGKSLKPHAMYYHMKYKHSSEKTHKCTLCTKKFKTKDNITR